jgi:hypothetical protein
MRLEKKLNEKKAMTADYLFIVRQGETEANEKGNVSRWRTDN